MGKRPRYDRIEPYQPPERPEAATQARHARSHANVTPDASASDESGPASGRRGRREPAKPGDLGQAASAAPQPVDVDGVAIVTVGTILWAIAFVALLPFRSRLADHNIDWWLWTCLAGVAMGLWGINYCRRRRNRIRARDERAAPRQTSS
jgi:Protein of unknown function (DUF2530)